MYPFKILRFALALLLVASLPAAAQMGIGKQVAPAGGGGSGNGIHTIVCTVGQPCVGVMAAGSYRHLVGFLAPGMVAASEIEELPGLPQRFSLAQNAPNPFGPTTTIRFDLPEARHVRLEVFSADGRRMASLVDETRAAGHLAVRWDGRDAQGRFAPSGTYLYRLTAGDFTATQRMLLMR
jgi:hypothetical protein